MINRIEKNHGSDRLMKRRLGVLVLMVLVILVVREFICDIKICSGVRTAARYISAFIMCGCSGWYTGFLEGQFVSDAFRRCCSRGKAQALLTVHSDPGKAVFQGGDGEQAAHG